MAEAMGTPRQTGDQPRRGDNGRDISGRGGADPDATREDAGDPGSSRETSFERLRGIARSRANGLVRVETRDDTVNTSMGHLREMVVEVYVTWEQSGAEFMLHTEGPTLSDAAQRCLYHMDRLG